MQLPETFIETTRKTMGEELFSRYLASFDEPSPVSIRINPFKKAELDGVFTENVEEVPWCKYGRYLSERPNFTFDPMFHAGCYYVQEASSMFVAQIMQQYVEGDVTMLDLCAAPGGKSTCVRSYLSEKSVLICNEPIRNRANILYENITKFGTPNTFVTNNYPVDFRKSKLKFDVILADVPCSGEGMFRKDPATISEWTPQNVEKCSRLQREIVEDVWPCLEEGGILIYSTCTFNTKEDEENARWICETLGAECLPVTTKPEWNIVGSLLESFCKPVYRFIPGHAKGEGIFCCVMRKQGSKSGKVKLPNKENNCITVRKSSLASAKTAYLSSLRIMTPEMLAKASSVVDALKAGSSYENEKVELTSEQAIAYLRRESIVLPQNTPRGMIVVAYHGQPLGFVKNVGSRANNLYPQPWAIRTTHNIPTNKSK